MWDFKDGIPIWQQIESIIRMGILNGTYAPGSKMPAVRELALQAGVNPNTMQRALGELERSRLLRTERTSGRFVTEDETVLKELRRELARDLIRELYQNLQQLGFDDEAIVREVGNFSKEQR